MSRIRICTTIPADPATVWADVQDLASHVEWMADAERIEFRGDQRSGVGTMFDCATRIGPARVTDVIEVTEWEPGTAIGIVHRGVVTGTGRFTLRAALTGGTRFCWEEELRFPWWMGGPLGARVAAPVLRAVWSRNLDRLRTRFPSS